MRERAEEEAERHAEQRVRDRERDDEPGAGRRRRGRAGRSATTQTIVACTAATSAERERVAEQQVEPCRAAASSAARACRVVRSRSIAIDVTRNIEMNGNRPTQRAADRGRTLRPGRRRRSGSSVSSTGGTTSRSASVRGSRRSWRRTRAAVGERDAGAHGGLREREEGGVEVVRAGPLEQLVRRRGARRCGRRASGAARRSARLVHDVARDEQRRAVVGEPVEGLQSSRRSTGSSPTVGSSSTSSSGSAEQRGRERDARALAAGERARRPGRRGRRASTVSSTSSIRASRRAEDRARSSAGSRAR